MALEVIAAEIAKLAFGAVVETGIGKLTEGAIINLRQKIKDKFQKNPDAEKAIASVEQGSLPDLTRVAQYLQYFMDHDTAFAQEVQRLASEINISNDNRSIHNTSDRSTKTVQARDNAIGEIGKIENPGAGTVNIGGTHNHH
ncbi:hypothetical protein [Limnofasciculus baicalensis]|uniref:Uncharacterized protein n=1 Tax=Limnofasciculus baicalensis BBK-W-15 TaxID=2699891 RepID=A0AAE3GXP8_9CYAN|nr:hypothetical protein [Limnofasciculus baicalensis]MCP2731783.1 hypothetical protein [Limnofasciculus baicalensis BBK-W-15]